MGYLNNTSRTLEAILTKRGREVLSGGGGFNITQFALGDDEIDYSLWDTTHVQGTDYYGAIIDNLPQLEPFNDPSEIMKYKLVTRPNGTKNMPYIRKSGAQTTLDNITLVYDRNSTTPQQLTTAGSVNIGGGVMLPTWETYFPYETTGTPKPVSWDIPAPNNKINEPYTLILLDVSVAILGPSDQNPDSTHNQEAFKTSPFGQTAGIYLNEQKSMSQTVEVVTSENQWVMGSVGNAKTCLVYPKALERRYTSAAPLKTKVIVSGTITGAVTEFNVNIYYTE